MNKTICYFLDNLNSPFVRTELDQFSREGYKVHLFLTGMVPTSFVLPDNITVYEKYLNWITFKPSMVLFRNFWFCFGNYFKESRLQKKVLPLRQSLATLASNIFKAEEITKILHSHKVDSRDMNFYSFWFYDCIFLALLKKKGRCARALVRAHGGDLFEERGSLSGKILFRDFQLKYIEYVFSASRVGTEYLKGKYPAYSKQIRTSYLGSVSQPSINPFRTENFTIVTCARIRNVKRIDFVAEVLLLINTKVTWIHIGDENAGAANDKSVTRYFSLKQKLQQKNNLTFRAVGHLTADEVFTLYKTEPVSLFLSLSEYEGLPVSMMEAASFGIPLVSTDVGGCREIVNEKTGILLPLKSGAPEVAKVLEDFPGSEKNTLAFRSGVREYWEQHFNSDNTYRDFFQTIRN